MAEAVKKTLSVLMQIGKEIFGPGYRPGEGTALGREFVKDVQNTWNEVAYGKPGHMGEPGTPFNPTPQLITEELKGKTVDGKTDMLTNEPTVHGAKQETTLDKMRGNRERPAQERQQERGGLER